MNPEQQLSLFACPNCGAEREITGSGLREISKGRTSGRCNGCAARDSWRVRKGDYVGRLATVRVSDGAREWAENLLTSGVLSTSDLRAISLAFA